MRPAFAGAGEPGDQFGAALQAANVRTSGLYDLVVGVPGEDLGSVLDVRMIHFIRGSSTRLTATGSQTWNPNTAGVLGPAQVKGMFGFSLG